MMLFKNFNRYGLKYWILSNLFIGIPKWTNRYLRTHPISYCTIFTLNRYNGFIQKIADLIPHKKYTPEEQKEREEIAREIIRKIMEK